jgi:hypothetical protein
MAAADYAEGEGEPPPELKTAMMCERWNTLPEAGGLLDQPAGLMERMTVLSNVNKTFRAMHASDDWTTWRKDNPDGAELIDEVNRLRKNGV